MPTVRLVDPSGIIRDVDESTAAAAFSAGWRPPTTEEEIGRLGTQAREAEYGGIGGQIKAGLLGAARGISVGGSDVLARAFGGEDTARAIAGYREQNPTTSLFTELGGAIAPALLTGGGSAGVSGAELGARGIAELAPSVLATRAGSAIARATEGSLGRLGSGAAGLAGEGALFGAGQGATELALSHDPLTVEHIGSTLGSNMLYGAGFGVAGGAAFHGIASGLRRAKGAVDAVADRMSAARELPGELGNLDLKGLRAARDVEVERLATDVATQQAAEKSAAVDDVLKYREAFDAADPWTAIPEGEASGQLGNAQRAYRGALNKPKSLRKNPARLLDALETEEQAFESTLSQSDELSVKFEQANHEIADGVEARLKKSNPIASDIREEIMAGKVPGENAKALTAAGIDAAVERELARRAASAESEIVLTGKEARRFATYADRPLVKGAPLTVTPEEARGLVDALRSGEVAGQRQAALANLPALLEQNRALQEQIRKSIRPPVPKSELRSDLLEKISNAEDVLKAPAPEKSFGEKLGTGVIYSGVVGLATALTGGIPLIGHAAGALAGAKIADSIAGAVFGKLGKGAAAQASRATKAASAFLGKAAGSAERAAPYVPLVATKILASVRFGDRHGRSEEPKSLPELYKRRTDEIKSLIAIADDGSYKMRPSAREQLASKFDGIRPHAPILADRFEALGAKRIEWLASQLPRKPEIYPYGVGPDKWQPSDMEMRSFARLVAAVEDPIGVLERAIHGAVTPEDSKAIQAVHPEILNQWANEVATRLPELRESLPYQRKLAMGILTGIPIDPALDPRVLKVLQSQFVDEPGTEGGTQAPRANPAFGSVRKSIDAPTPAQSRGQGEHA